MFKRVTGMEANFSYSRSGSPSVYWKPLPLLCQTSVRFVLLPAPRRLSVLITNANRASWCAAKLAEVERCRMPAVALWLRSSIWAPGGILVLPDRGTTMQWNHNHTMPPPSPRLHVGEKSLAFDVGVQEDFYRQVIGRYGR